ncbi:phytoene desaturase family protein [Streptomyces europaeiscabiei]|uniref:phytoene desaturase family protein n=1 Tax=Streptomyces europaeiscabiei TaxID=146819 RepID=UPI00099DFFE1|nr:NAD(P)/FAD-dependent oxidoreductase [Streptomyces europaeiscabiei]MDX2527329.1 NAD(P)/FAD-dependent oxidoreductase [Streptomyces europaeiscabiei]
MFRTNVQNAGRDASSCGKEHTSRHADRFTGSRVDVVVIGGGMAGMATALRLQAAGLSTIVLEAHGHAGGCAGYYRKRGFSFDVGATTLVDFGPGGVGGELLDSVGIPLLDAQELPGYQAHLPDRQIVLHRDQAAWHAERLRTLGDSERHRAFWDLLDRLAHTFWRASRAGVRLPIRGPADALHDLRAVGWSALPYARHLNRTLGDALRDHGLRADAALVGLLAMLVEDTVHTGVDDAPLINAALGVTIRGAGLSRHNGGMHGFWRVLVGRYRELGGSLRTACRVTQVQHASGGYRLTTRQGTFHARRIVSAVPAVTTAAICAGLPVAPRLRRYLRRDADAVGGATVVFLGVPESEVADQPLTHHQLLQSYDRPLGDGNNMFVSVSAPGDPLSAPPGHRAVMLSTHTDLADWRDLDTAEYEQRKKETGEQLLARARRVYPRLGERAVIAQTGTPRSYERFAFRPQGAVGGVRQRLANTNQHAIPHDLGGPGLWLVGDSTWPGLGTVACVLGSRIVAEGLLKERRRAG